MFDLQILQCLQEFAEIRTLHSQPIHISLLHCTENGCACRHLNQTNNSKRNKRGKNVALSLLFLFLTLHRLVEDCKPTSSMQTFLSSINVRSQCLFTTFFMNSMFFFFAKPFCYCNPHMLEQ